MLDFLSELKCFYEIIYNSIICIVTQTFITTRLICYTYAFCNSRGVPNFGIISISFLNISLNIRFNRNRDLTILHKTRRYSRFQAQTRNLMKICTFLYMKFTLYILYILAKKIICLPDILGNIL